VLGYTDDEVRVLFDEETNRLKKPDGRIRSNTLSGGVGEFYFVNDDDVIPDLLEAGLTIRNIHDEIVLTDE